MSATTTSTSGPTSGAKLADAFVIRAIGMADRQGPVVEPDHVAAFQPPLAFDGAGDGNAEPAIGLAGDAGLAAPRGLAHVAEDHARGPTMVASRT